MARFDVFANPFAAERSHTPFVLDVQNDHLGLLASRVVIPLRNPAGFGRPASDLNPLLTIAGQPLVLDTANLAPVQALRLKTRVDRVEGEREQVLTALDTLFGAF
jgi:toxin CcdB